MLHFGLAAEKINAAGKTRVGKVVVGDDVAVGRKGGGLVGRRGMTGTIAGKSNIHLNYHV
jgi:dihydroxyacetone kinase